MWHGWKVSENVTLSHDDCLGGARVANGLAVLEGRARGSGFGGRGPDERARGPVVGARRGSDYCAFCSARPSGRRTLVGRPGRTGESRLGLGGPLRCVDLDREGGKKRWIGFHVKQNGKKKLELTCNFQLSK